MRRALLPVFCLFLRAAEGLPDVVHCPPAGFNGDRLDVAVNGTGPPGVYTSSDTPADQYGTYNWCNMPHVRAAEYIRAPTNYTLVYIEVIQRHHKRTPYMSNLFRQEDIQWDCTGQGPYVGGKGIDTGDTAGVYLQGARGTMNPFERQYATGFEGSTCQFPAITSQGLTDAKQHGADFRSVYGDMLGFLPRPEERGRYQWRVTNNAVTSQTLSGFIKGVYPGTTVDYAMIQPDQWDSLEPAFSCPLYNQVSDQIRGNNANWTEHLTASAALRARFIAVSGVDPNDGGWAASWDHPYDNLSSKQCHQYPLPCSVNDTTTCVGQADADAIYRLGNWEYAYTWRGHPNSTLAAMLRMGPWVDELRQHLREAVEGRSETKYHHNFAHDGSMAALLGLLQVDKPVWPGMGSEIVFELYKAIKSDEADDSVGALYAAVGGTSQRGGTALLPLNVRNKAVFATEGDVANAKAKSSAYYLRVLWNGQPMVTSTPMGELDMISLQDFEAYLVAMWPEDFVALCNIQNGYLL